MFIDNFQALSYGTERFNRVRGNMMIGKRYPMNVQLEPDRDDEKSIMGADTHRSKDQGLTKNIFTGGIRCQSD